MTLAQLAGKASRVLSAGPDSARGVNRTGSVSASYVCLIESGRKVPDEPIAVALARALEDDSTLYSAWVRARKRSDLRTALSAAETLREWLASPANSPSAEVRGASDAPPRGHAMTAPSARLRVPVIPEGVDPGPGVRPSCEVLEWRRLDADALSSEYRARLDRPFAYRLSEQGARRVRDRFHAGDHVIVLRGFVPPTPEEVYAVRDGDRVLLSRILWNGTLLLLRPSEGQNDFAVLDAGDESRLRSLILGVATRANFE